ncbi:hypothetical protein K458DRAFT_319319 [Lentithecium fluviatile CBS 122367]|uniref:BZIP domain-containing protein n=1 Tax=Lentithecium fluviatile CBS 122367 TaxID=1168545 RepID=A0A6G1IH29_9PLEO|nr:hypothetical protein K458DRAFT_319319 [Lentithecium fluviatile CBS 122367]
MSGSDSEGQGQSRPRKRPRRMSTGGEEGGAAGKKARGRPRVDTQDATAADRRRTQIRLAQRAYRQRKESTISSLKDQNTRLQNIIEQMNKSFLQFNDSALKSGLLQINPALAQQLKQVTENFVALAKSAAESSEGEEDAVDSMQDVLTEGQRGSPTTETSQDQQAYHQPMDIGWGYSAPPRENSHQQAFNSSAKDPRRHTPCFQPEQTTTKESGLVKFKRPVSVGQLMDQGGTAWNEPRREEPSTSQQLPFGLVDILSRQQYSAPGNQPSQIYSVNIPTPDMTPPYLRLPTPPQLPSLSLKSLAPAWTYSHDETTFARRLTRAALETGFHLLSAANQRPAALNHVFKLSLPYMTLSELRERFRMLLARGTNEDLDCWETPFIHLGGAGTHYQRKDVQGNVVKIPNAWTVRRIGPLTSKMIRAENASDPSQSHDLNIDLTGFEGEWFDAYDVEGYLEQEKGVHIDPRDSFAEVTIDDDFVPNKANDIGNRVYAPNPSKFDYSRTRRSVQSDTPSFSTGTDSTPSSTTPTHNDPRTSSIDNFFGQSDAPFGLDMGVSLNSNFPGTDFSKFPDIDPSTFFDQPLGLDLAPGFDLPFNLNHHSTLPPINYDNEGVDMGALGLDMMAAGNLQAPVARHKKQKAAWVDVSKLIDAIIKHGVCLGRAPGFRRKDVDMAFEASLITAF